MAEFGRTDSPRAPASSTPSSSPEASGAVLSMRGGSGGYSLSAMNAGHSSSSNSSASTAALTASTGALSTGMTAANNGAGKDMKKVQKIEKKEAKKEQKLMKKSSAEEVAAWLLDLGLPHHIAEKYIKLFEEEEIFTLAQVRQLTAEHLHSWMGVKTGTVLLMLEAIAELGSAVPGEGERESIRSALKSQRAESIMAKTQGKFAPSAASDLDTSSDDNRKRAEKDARKAEKEARKLEKKQEKGGARALPLSLAHGSEWGDALTPELGPKSPRSASAPLMVTTPPVLINGPVSHTDADAPLPVPRITMSTADESGASAADAAEEDEMFQAGGHGDVSRVPELPGYVRKATSKSECEFYLALQTTDLIPQHIKGFFAKLESVHKKNDGFAKKRFVTMEDLTWGYKRPCIMDVKMGTRTAGKDANIVKRKYMISKDVATTTATTGMRIVASKHYDVRLHDFRALTRAECNAISTETQLERALKAFFHNGITLRTDVLVALVRRLRVLNQWVRTQRAFRFYSSSLLFVYEGDVDEPLRIDVRMIDFAHVFEIKDGGRDDGYAKGLQRLLRFFEDFIREAGGSESLSRGDDDCSSELDDEMTDERDNKDKSARRGDASTGREDLRQEAKESRGPKDGDKEKEKEKEKDKSGAASSSGPSKRGSTGPMPVLSPQPKRANSSSVSKVPLERASKATSQETDDDANSRSDVSD